MRSFVIGVCLVLFGTTAVPALAQPVITSPTSNQLFRTGPDYATDILQDAWDFSNREDISPNPDEFGGWATNPANNWYAIGTGATFISGGRFQGTGSGDNQLAMLYRGDAIGLNPGRTGVRFPIDTARYRKLSMKIRYTGATGPPFFQPAVYWYHVSAAADNFLNRAGGALFSIIPAGTTDSVHVLDLTLAGAAGTGSQLVPACGGAGCTGVPAPWTAESTVRGFRIDPTTQSTTLGIEVDWVRLTASDSSPSAAMMSVSLQAGSCTGSSSIGVRDASGVVTTVLTGASTGGASFNYGVFPPGAYTLIVTCGNGTSEQAFTINNPPQITVVNPDEIGDTSTDYAFRTSNGGNRWDFEEATPTDIAATANISTTAGACASGGCGIVPSDRAGAPAGSKMFRASSVGTTPSELGDPALDFLGGATTPLSSLRHRYLTFSMRINRPYDLGPEGGSVLRMLWGSRTFTSQATMTNSQDLRVWPGFHTYTIDLSALTVANGGIETECTLFNPPCPLTLWTERSIRFLRLDPHEFPSGPTSFDLDDVSLNAPDEVHLGGSGTGSTFTIAWALADSDTSGSSSYSTRIWIDTDRDPSNGRTEITTSALSTTVGTNEFVWTPPVSTPPAVYWVYVETTETRSGVTNTQASYSSGALVVYSSTATSPQITMTAPTPNTQVPFPFTITGCAFDQGNTSGLNMDEVAVFAIAGTGVTGIPAGTTYALGYGNGLGTIQYAPLTPSTPVDCPSIATGSPFRQSGYRITDVGLNAGPWTLRVFGRSTISGLLTQIASDVPITVSQLSLGPVNFQLTGSGNNITISFQAPSGGPPVTGYVIDVSTNAQFNPLLASVVVPSAGSYNGELGNGTFFFRVVTLAAGGARQTASETRQITLPTGGPPPPGPPVLTATQVASNPITISWAAGSGGAPASYTLFAGSTPGGSEFGAFPMGGATSISANAPLGIRIFIRLQATNSAGSAISNEINFLLGAPSAPVAPTLNPATLNGRNVTFTWAPGSGGGAPTSYTLIARQSQTGPVIASLPGIGVTSFSVNAPPGTYFISVQAANGAGTSPESNQITVIVP